MVHLGEGEWRKSHPPADIATQTGPVKTLGSPFLIMGGMRAGFSRQSAGEASPTARKSRSPKMADSWV